MKTSSKKAKGQELQKIICEKISNLLDIPWGKDEEIASRPSSQSGTDIILSPRIRKIFPFAIECKNHKSWSVPAAIKQAKSNCSDGLDWLLVFQKKSRKVEERIAPVVILDAEVFFSLLGKIHDKRQISKEETNNI